MWPHSGARSHLSDGRSSFGSKYRYLSVSGDAFCSMRASTTLVTGKFYNKRRTASCMTCTIKIQYKSCKKF